MTRALILVGVFLTASVSPLPAPAGRQDAQQAPVTKPATNTSDQSGAEKNSPAKSNPGSAVAKPNSSLSKRPLRPKNKVSTCNEPSPAAAPTDATPPGSAASVAGATNPSTGASTSESRPGTAPTNCPPSKKIVPHGGTSEPNIQLAGGPVGNQASQQRDSANQMLAVTEQNLAKIAGRELSASQQDMVNQTRQFMQQAKAAVAAEDFDRARTLAWKAQLLSEELATPPK